MPLFNFDDPNWIKTHPWAKWWKPLGHNKQSPQQPRQQQPRQQQPQIGDAWVQTNDAYGKFYGGKGITQQQQIEGQQIAAPSPTQQVLYNLLGAMGLNYFNSAPQIPTVSNVLFGAPMPQRPVPQEYSPNTSIPGAATSQIVHNAGSAPPGAPAPQQQGSLSQTLHNSMLAPQPQMATSSTPQGGIMGAYQGAAQQAQSQINQSLADAMQRQSALGQQSQSQMGNVVSGAQQNIANQGQQYQGQIGNIVNNTMGQVQNQWGNAPQQIDLETAKRKEEASIQRNLIRQQQLATKSLADAMGARGLAGSGVQAARSAQQAATIGRQMADAQAKLADLYTGRALQQRGQDINIWGTRGNAMTNALLSGMGAQTGAAGNVFGTNANAILSGMGLQGGLLRDIYGQTSGLNQLGFATQGKEALQALANRASLLQQGMAMTPAMAKLQQEAYWAPLQQAMGYQAFNEANRIRDIQLQQQSNALQMAKSVLGLGPQYANVAAALIGGAYGGINNAFSGLMNYAAAQASKPDSSGGMPFSVGLNLAPSLGSS